MCDFGSSASLDWQIERFVKIYCVWDKLVRVYNLSWRQIEGGLFLKFHLWEGHHVSTASKRRPVRKALSEKLRIFNFFNESSLWKACNCKNRFVG